ncbi:helix-turn-helix domain-containing protein [Lactococcus formosensis]|uniref:Helix-turn-helix domain-containing protein n=1 Tax=Lactococcus formosensis TaxID=1281486 RepID=A0A9X4P5P9_9LACT|nr:helix-turn-helix transcriptional regulator [Lactococcus formosensis]MDG6142025.1 helix-turn-helix domain-containing protein [Lactococcus formosensis]MDG6159229.1 helix-turn-helix domain-containing protein [Lactococcus formosensis]MDG6165464.1 helix-turn-helix domain-containing protein [Lactococcus formosensis]MDG6171917.1 helix-turn-helix domain-containing protein [Lactococcus formosensis]MDG6192683.1 helix-turn-helix domain-containing protein [Lactococcus formosensis]
MNEITENIARAIRRKRADLGLTKKQVYTQLDISFRTYNKIELGGFEVKNNVYQKITNWLAKDY